MKRILAVMPFAVSFFVGLTGQLNLHGQVQQSPNTMTAGENFSSPDATLDDVQWIAGQWQGEAMGGSFEETWTAPQGESMMGMFRHVVDGKTNFYELLTIVPNEQSLILRLKHFSPELHGWEEKGETVDFPLVKLTENEAFFDGLTFRRLGPDELHIFVVIKAEDAAPKEIKFAARRVNAKSADNAAAPMMNESMVAIERVLAEDAAFSRARDQLTHSRSLADAVEIYSAALDTIDWIGCPEDFVKAFKRHQSAWRDFLPFLEQHGNLRGEMHDLLDQLRSSDSTVADQLNKHIGEIMSTWDEVDEAKLKAAPGKESS